MGEIKMLESIYGNVPDILSQLIRTMLVPKEGCEFIVADFSAIEARVLAWLSETARIFTARQRPRCSVCPWSSMASTES